MRIRADISALRQSSAKEIALRFVCGGAITVIASMVSQNWGATVGGLFLAFPAIFPAGATLVEQHEIKRKQKLGLEGTKRARGAAAAEAAGAALASLGLIVFAAVNWQMLSRHSAWWVIPTATLAWGCVALAAWSIRQHHTRWNRRRSQRRAAMHKTTTPVPPLRAHGSHQ